MVKVAILGTENSHAACFASRLLGKGRKHYADDLELIGVYGDVQCEDAREGNNNVRAVSDCPEFAEHYNDFLDRADAIMITARHGANHLKYAFEYLKKGIPIWIDKPFTADVEDACKLVEMAKTYGSPLCGGSSLVYTPEVRELAALVKKEPRILGGHVTSQISLSNDYGGFWFYAQHLVSMMLCVFGMKPLAVSATRRGNTVRAVYRYSDYDVTALFGTGFSVTVYRDGNDAQARSIYLNDDFFVPELEAFYKMVTTGKGIFDYNELIAPIAVIDATVRAMEQNCEVEIFIPDAN